MNYNLVPSKSIIWVLQDSRCSILDLEEEKQAVEEEMQRHPSFFVQNNEFNFDGKLIDESSNTKNKNSS